MNFIGSGKRLAAGDIGTAARRLGVETAVLLAFVEVEAAGRGFDNQNRPKMLFEPHIFYRELGPGKMRDMAEKAGLAYKNWKAGNYPKDSYPRLIQAMAIHEEAALRSASWGLPQILGQNFGIAGFSSAKQMVQAMIQGETEQLNAMITFLEKSGFVPLLKNKDFTKASSWEAPARKYNGPAYATHGYHTKLAKAYQKHAGTSPVRDILVPARPMQILVKGTKGEAVRELQSDLQSLGYRFGFGIDGRFGNETYLNLKDFQAKNGLDPDGKYGPNTQAKLKALIAKNTVEYEPTKPVWPQQKTETTVPKTGIAAFGAIIVAAGTALAKYLGWF